MIAPVLLAYAAKRTKVFLTALTLLLVGCDEPPLRVGVSGIRVGNTVWKRARAWP
jgi:hypothetical protein